MSALPKAIIQDRKHEEATDRYTHINTMDIIESLEEKGFELDGYRVANVRKLSNDGFQKHLVTMRAKSLETKEGVPTVIIQNSHNRTSGLKFHTGFIRFACLNGLILGENINEQKIRHSSNWIDKARVFLDNYDSEVRRMSWQHDVMKGQYMSSSMIDEFTHLASAIRYEPVNVMDNRELALVRRIEDKGNDLYTVYNRVQEALIHGLFQRRIVNVDEENNKIESAWGKANKITSNDEIIRINKEVRELAWSFAR